MGSRHEVSAPFQTCAAPCQSDHASVGCRRPQNPPEPSGVAQEVAAMLADPLIRWTGRGCLRRQRLERLVRRRGAKRATLAIRS
jgi:hypothetical protein